LIIETPAPVAPTPGAASRRFGSPSRVCAAGSLHTDCCHAKAARTAVGAPGAAPPAAALADRLPTAMSGNVRPETRRGLDERTQLPLGAALLGRAGRRCVDRLIAGLGRVGHRRRLPAGLGRAGRRCVDRLIAGLGCAGHRPRLPAGLGRAGRGYVDRLIAGLGCAGHLRGSVLGGGGHETAREASD
jgi:hypothetical protein